MSSKPLNPSIESIYKDNLWEGAYVETKIIETPGKDFDFDSINDENIKYSRYTGP